MMAESERLILRPGSRALEERLLADVVEALDTSGTGAGSPPLRLVVSSGALRRHLAARLVSGDRKVLTGIVIQTLWTLALEILEAAGRPPVAGGEFFEVLARRQAAAAPELAPLLAGLRDGPGTVIPSVRDLYSAGFEPEHLEAALSCLESRGDDPSTRSARGVLRVAAETAAAMREAGIGRIDDVLHAATEALKDGEAEALVGERVFVHGFSDVTGRGLDLIEALFRGGARVYVDAPPDPEGDGADAPLPAFIEPLVQRLLPGATFRMPSGAGAPRPTIQVFDAAGAEGEARETACRIHELLRQGAHPETIAVVTRAAGTHDVALRRAFDRLGIPYTGGRLPAGSTPLQRRVDAGLRVLAAGGDAPVDRWLDACGPAWRRRMDARVEGARQPSFVLEDLRLGLRTLGLARIRDVAALDPEAVLGPEDGLPLPARRGLAPSASGAEGDDDSERGATAHRRRLHRIHLQRAVEAARGILAAASERSGTRPIAQWVPLCRAHLEQAFGWSPSTGEGEAPHAAALRELERAPLPATPIDLDEFLLVLRRELDPLLDEALGGRGGGVRLLDAARARYLTFDHLFLLGLNRDVFPRAIGEDPFLKDAQRRALGDVLPDLFPRSRGHDEERYLFQHLLALAPHITLGFQRVDDEGRELGASPLVERLLRGPLALSSTRLPRLRKDLLRHGGAPSDTRPWTARESLLMAGLCGEASLYDQLLPLAVAEGADPLLESAGTPAPAEDVGAARAAILKEFETPPREFTAAGGRRHPGPYLGEVGPILPTDPRNQDPFATTLEGLARCPWQTFVGRILRIEPTPDPLAAFPTLSPLMVGSTVHEALEDLVVEETGAGPATLAAALERGPRPLSRPDEERARRAALAAAQKVCREEGIVLAGLAQALADLALPFVMRGLDLCWPDEGGTGSVLGTETLGQVELTSLCGRLWTVRFRADRVDLAEDGTLVLSDYKTGKPLSSGKKADTRLRHLRREIAQGKALQAALYAAAGGGRETLGRYVYLKPDLDPELALQGITGDDPAVTKALPERAATLLGALEEGVLPPLLEEAPGRANKACTHCELKDACLHGDSGARTRLRELGATLRAEALAGETSSAAALLFARLWWREPLGPSSGEEQAS